MKSMTIFGVSKKVAAVAGPWLLITLTVSLALKPLFSFSFDSPWVLRWGGASLILFGIAMLYISSIQLLQSWKEKQLITTYFFRLFKHPFFTAWILLLIPGLSLLFDTWLTLTTSLILYVCTQIFGKEEEKWLESQYGAEYREYRKKIIFPFF